MNQSLINLVSNHHQQSFNPLFLKHSKEVFKCIKCQEKPHHQFIILLCDHIVCDQCLNPDPQLECQLTESESQYPETIQRPKRRHMRNKQTFGANQFLQEKGKKLKLSKGYEGIRCPCGVITYFKSNDQDQQLLDEQSQRQKMKIYKSHHYDEKYKNQQYDYQMKRSSTRPSTGLIYSRNTIPAFTNTNQNNRYHKTRIQTQPFNDDDYKFLKRMRSSSKERKDDHAKNRGRYWSPHQSYVSRQNRETHKVDKNSLKRSQMRTALNEELMQKSLYSIQSKEMYNKNPFYDQLRIELDYLQNQYHYHINSLQRYFKRIISAMNESYRDLEETVENLCMSNIAMGSKSNLDLGKILSARYEDDIAHHIQSLGEYLDNFYRLRYKPNKYADILKGSETKIKEIIKEKVTAKQKPSIKQNSYKASNHQTEILPNKRNHIINIYSRDTKNHCDCLNKSTYCLTCSKKLHKKKRPNRTDVIIEL